MHVLTSAGQGVNPYTRHFNHALTRQGCTLGVASSRELLLGSFDVWHINWPEASYKARFHGLTVVRAAKMLLLMALVRLRRKQIVWTVHNLLPHDTKHRAIDRAFFRSYVHLVSGTLHLSEAGRSAAFVQYRPLEKKPSRVAMHGTYDEFIPLKTSTDRARRKLEIPKTATVFAVLGAIVRYKRVDRVATAFRDLTGDGYRLLIGGKPNESQLVDDLRAIAEDDRRVLMELEMLSDERLDIMLAASDIVVLTHGEFLNSGVVLLGVSTGRVVLVPNTPVTQEIAQAAGDEWVRLYDGELTSQHLHDCAVHSKELRHGAANLASPDLDSFSWENLAHASIELYGESRVRLARRLHRPRCVGS